MARYELTKAAAGDFEAIFEYGLDRFGFDQAVKYQHALIERFDAIAAHPDRYAPVDQIRRGYRRTVCGVHSIYYRVTDGEVIIVRILGRQDPARAF